FSLTAAAPIQVPLGTTESFQLVSLCVFFFFNDTATTEIYTLSLHDALPIYLYAVRSTAHRTFAPVAVVFLKMRSEEHTSNSSHTVISYAVFCLKKKKTR